MKHLAILGHSWGLASSAPEGPHSQTAGSPRKIREIRFAAKVLRTTEVIELGLGFEYLGLRRQRRTRTTGRRWRRRSLKRMYKAYIASLGQKDS